MENPNHFRPCSLFRNPTPVFVRPFSLPLHVHDRLPILSSLVGAYLILPWPDFAMLAKMQGISVPLVSWPWRSRPSGTIEVIWGAVVYNRETSKMPFYLIIIKGLKRNAALHSSHIQPQDSKPLVAANEANEASELRDSRAWLLTFSTPARADYLGLDIPQCKEESSTQTSAHVPAILADHNRTPTTQSH